MGAIGRDLFAVIRYSGDETVILLTNRSDQPQNAVLYPTMLFEGADGDTPVPFSGIYFAENGEQIPADATIRVSIPPCGYRLLCKDNV